MSNDQENKISPICNLLNEMIVHDNKHELAGKSGKEWWARWDKMEAIGLEYEFARNGHPLPYMAAMHAGWKLGIYEVLQIIQTDFNDHYSEEQLTAIRALERILLKLVNRKEPLSRSVVNE